MTERNRELTLNELNAVSGGGNDLQCQDKLGNFEIQSLMSNFNEAQTTLSSIQKSAHDPNNTIIGKI
jgi:hypothetical protein